VGWNVTAHALTRRVVTTRQRLLLWHCLCEIVVLLLGLLITPLHDCYRVVCTLTKRPLPAAGAEAVHTKRLEVKGSAAPRVPLNVTY
jgi:hypothetical protein